MRWQRMVWKMTSGGGRCYIVVIVMQSHSRVVGVETAKPLSYNLPFPA